MLVRLRKYFNKLFNKVAGNKVSEKNIKKSSHTNSRVDNAYPIQTKIEKVKKKNKIDKLQEKMK